MTRVAMVSTDGGMRTPSTRRPHVDDEAEFGGDVRPHRSSPPAPALRRCRSVPALARSKSCPRCLLAPAWLFKPVSATAAQPAVRRRPVVDASGARVCLERLGIASCRSNSRRICLRRDQDRRAGAGDVGADGHRDRLRGLHVTPPAPGRRSLKSEARPAAAGANSDRTSQAAASAMAWLRSCAACRRAASCSAAYDAGVSRS
jgi:hypothetical protein